MGYACDRRENVQGFGGKRKRPLGRPKCRWEDEIKMDLGEIGLGMSSGFSWLKIGVGKGLL
jgi:hypothetical protein